MQSLGIPGAVDTENNIPAGRSSGRLIIYVLVVIIIAAAAYYVYRLQHPPQSVTTSISTVPARVDTILGVVNSTGQIAPWNQAKLSFQAAGQIATVAVKVGDNVKKGQTLATLDSTNLKIQVEQAQAKLEIAQAKLASIQAGPRPEDVLAAQAIRDAQQAKLDGMLAGGRPEDVAASQAALASAQAQLHQLRQGALPADIVAAQTAIDTAQALVTQRQTALADLTRPPDPQTVTQAELAVSSAKANLWKSQSARDAVCSMSFLQDQRCGGANAQIGIDTATLASAQAKLSLLEEGPKPEDVAAAQAAIAQAQSQVTSAKARLAQVKAGTLPDQIIEAEQTVAQAQDQITLKQHPYTDSDIAQQRQVVAQANAQLALKKAPYVKSDVDGAKAAVDAAQADLDLANSNLKATSIPAPFDGTISDVFSNVGEFYNALTGTPVVAIVDPSDLRLDVSVDETDITHIQVGQDVNVTFDALPGKTFTGKVIAIAPNAAVQSGVATYTASVTLQNAQGVRPGMTGNADIIYARHDNVLLVPNRAVRTDGTNHTVSVLVGNQVKVIPVTTGVSDDQFTEITSGLKAGDQVVIPSTAPVAPQFAGGPKR